MQSCHPVSPIDFHIFFITLFPKFQVIKTASSISDLFSSDIRVLIYSAQALKREKPKQVGLLCLLLPHPPRPHDSKKMVSFHLPFRGLSWVVIQELKPFEMTKTPRGKWPEFWKLCFPLLPLPPLSHLILSVIPDVLLWVSHNLFLPLVVIKAVWTPWVRLSPSGPM